MFFLKALRQVLAGGAAFFLAHTSLYAQEKAQSPFTVSAYDSSDVLKIKKRGWKGFLDERLNYNATHRFTIRNELDTLSEGERERVSLNEIAAKHARSVVRKSFEQTLREELITRVTLDDWVEDHISEPIETFVVEKILDPASSFLTYPFRSLIPHFRDKISDTNNKPGRYRGNFVQDVLTGRVEKNQLIDPLNNEGVPGEEKYQYTRLPRKFALGARPFQGNSYVYGTLRIGEVYTHARLSAADMFDSPRLNEAALLFQTQLNPHSIIFSFGGKRPFKDEKKPEHYFGPYGFIGLSKIMVSNGNKSFGETYLETKVGKEQGIFLSFNISY